MSGFSWSRKDNTGCNTQLLSLCVEDMKGRLIQRDKKQNNQKVVTAFEKRHGNGMEVGARLGTVHANNQKVVTALFEKRHGNGMEVGARLGTVHAIVSAPSHDGARVIRILVA